MGQPRSNDDLNLSLCYVVDVASGKEDRCTRAVSLLWSGCNARPLARAPPSNSRGTIAIRSVRHNLLLYCIEERIDAACLAESRQRSHYCEGSLECVHCMLFLGIGDGIVLAAAPLAHGTRNVCRRRGRVRLQSSSIE